MIRIHKIKIPIFNGSVNLIFGDASEVKDYLISVYNNNEFEFDENSANGICLTQGSQCGLWFDVKDFDISVLIHELDHAVFEIMNYFGLELSDQEIHCYLLEYLVKECQNIFAIQMDLSWLR